jgi:UDP-2-acetamido-3-amino-2,3-dideoxy-glucuronate N-acetyltransferase
LCSLPLPRSKLLRNEPVNSAPYRLIDDVDFGENVIVSPFTNLYGCRIGDETRIGPFVEIQRDAVIGARCKIQSHAFICTGVTIEDEVFVGHGVLFINDKFPSATSELGALKTEDDWVLVRTVVEHRAALGSGAVVLGGTRIGEGALVGGGVVVATSRLARRLRACPPERRDRASRLGRGTR